MRAAVVIPWLGGCPYRESALRFVTARYQDRHPELRVVIAEGPDPWIKACAVYAGLRDADADIVAIADADVWTDGLCVAIEAVENGAAWAVPHAAVYRLDEVGTAAYVAGEDHVGLPLTQRAYRGFLGGGITVLRRKLFEEVPMDPRFVGWGQEDECWAMALHVLAGPAWRGNAPMVHLYHPPQERMTRRWGTREGRALMRRYQRARVQPDLMRDLIEEAKQCRSPA